MEDHRDDRPPRKPDDRASRLAAELRANLARRKAQARNRRAGEASPPKTKDGETPDRD